MTIPNSSATCTSPNSLASRSTSPPALTINKPRSQRLLVNLTLHLVSHCQRDIRDVKRWGSNAGLEREEEEVLGEDITVAVEGSGLERFIAGGVGRGKMPEL